MRIVEVNYSDLTGRIFGGYDLHLSLNEIDGVSATQFVVTKYSDTPSVKAFDADEVIHQELRYLERKYSVNQLLMPYGRQLLREQIFLDADVVHLQIIHSDTISLLDLPEIMARDNVVWTIHDPWVVTGNCVHPLACEKWKTGCGGCENLEIPGFEMTADHTAQMWRLKKRIFSLLNPYVIVASEFMENYIRNSPLTSHWNRIARIPFGVKENFLVEFEREKVRKQFGIAPEQFVIGFRMSKDPVKGCDYIFQALELLDCKLPIQLFLVGDKDEIPDFLRHKYPCIGPRWLREEDMICFYQAIDIFLMPSLAESFGMMAVEATACETVVVCFRSTVMEELIQAPECGVAVEYGSPAAIAEAIRYLISDAGELEARKTRGKQFVARTYQYSEYVKQHLNLYKKITDKI